MDRISERLTALGVRENLRKYKKMPLREVLNLSLNETLSRTLMTIFTVLIAVLAEASAMVIACDDIADVRPITDATVKMIS